MLLEYNKLFDNWQLSSLARHNICGVPPKKLHSDMLPIVNGFWKEIEGYFQAKKKERKEGRKKRKKEKGGK